MKKLMLVLLLLLVPVLVYPATITWTQESTYAKSGAIVPAEKMATVVTHLYADGVEFAAVSGGATKWSGTLPQEAGQSKTYTAIAVLDGVPSATSAPTVFVWYLPLVAPGTITIQLSP